MDDFEPRGGALRYQDPAGVWQCANPGDPLFSTVTMAATEYYTEDKGWQPIFTDAEGSDA